jgi:hypothetical protein
MEESTVPSIHTPVTVCGDIHGQFFDLQELFKTGGSLPDTQYVFLVSYFVECSKCPWFLFCTLGGLCG